MESPESWDRLTGSLAVWPLDDPSGAYEFLVRQKLVVEGKAEDFLRLHREEIARGEITGPSMASRIAYQVKKAGLVLPAAKEPDPWGKRSEKERGRI